MNSSYECVTCGAMVLEASEDKHADWHRALEGSEYEWACEWKTFRDGDYDRMISHHPLSRLPLTEAEAREEVNNMTAGRIPARLIRRRVSGWSAA